MSEIVYAVHTRACTYLLDEDGFCKWVLSRSGAKSDDRCVGAQFVAALDLRSKGGLIGELRIGAQALFIRHENGRFALIRTKPIEHVEIRGAEGHGFEGDEGDEGDTLPEPDPVVLPDHLAVAAVFDAPAPAPEPPPPSARVILQTPSHAHHAYNVAAPIEEPAVPPLPAPPPARAFPQAPPRSVPPSRPPPPAYVEPPRAAYVEPPRAAYAEPPRAYEAPVPSFPEPPAPISPPVSARKFPEPPPRPRASQPRNDPALETQPLPSTGPLPPTGPVPAWPPVMMAPPPPQAEMVPLAPVRAPLASAEELDVDDLEEVGDDDQIYSMEVTLTLPLYRGESLPVPARRPVDPRHSRR